MRQGDPLSQETVDFGGVRLRMLVTDAVASRFARKSVKLECDLQPLLSRHRAVPLDLRVQCLGGRHVPTPQSTMLE